MTFTLSAQDVKPIVEAPFFDESPPKKGEIFITIIDGEYGFRKDDSTFALGVYDRITRFTDEAYLVKINAKYGLTDKTGKVIIPVEYEHIYRQITGYITVKKNGKEGLYNYEGKQVFPCEYDKIKMSPKKEITLVKDGKMGIYNKNGIEIIPVNYDFVARFPTSHLSENHYLVKENGHCGILTSRATLLPIKFDQIYENNKLFVVKLGDLTGLYNSDGKEILPTIYDRIYFTESKGSNIAITEKDGKLGIVDNQGKTHLMGDLMCIRYILNSDHLYNPFTHNDNLYLSVQGKNGKWGVFDEKNCSLTIPLVYDSIVQKLERANRTYFFVQKGNKVGVINATNEPLIKFKYNQLIGNFMTSTQGAKMEEIHIIAKDNNSYGLINFHSEELIPLQYSELAKISPKDIYKAKTKTGYKLINSKNEIINAGPFDQVSEFDNGIALTFKDGEMRELNESGAFISESKPMSYHVGFNTFAALKLALILSLNNEDDQVLRDFAQKITPSKHLLFRFSKITHTYAYVEYLSPKTIGDRYYEVLLEVKRKWNETDYNQNILTKVEDYTVFEGRIYTNQREEEQRFGMRELDWILSNSIRLDGFWISTFFLKSSFK